MAGRQFDWIDDAFDDKKTAEDMERAKGPGLAMLLFAVVAIAATGLVVFSLVGLASLF